MITDFGQEREYRSDAEVAEQAAQYQAQLAWNAKNKPQEIGWFGNFIASLFVFIPCALFGFAVMGSDGGLLANLPHASELATLLGWVIVAWAIYIAFFKKTN